jgi:hypothetical protein
MSNSIALKSLNQYRKRDILAYLSLRYYLEPLSSRTDQWAQEVAVRLASKRNSSKLLKVKHFKGWSGEAPQYRDIYILSPNDIIAESALISQCSKYEEFKSNSSVYSYLINSDSRSVFKHYTSGLKKRYNSIQTACKKIGNEEIVYVDIKSFYPSIQLSRIKGVWVEQCLKTDLPKKYVNLGLSLIAKFEDEQNNLEVPGLLIGPMYSHLLANLYLKRLDDIMQKTTDNRYWRYVDDIVMVGSKKEVDEFINDLRAELKNLGLELHNETKYFRLKAEDWLNSENPVSSDLSKKWPNLIGDIKKLAIYNPEKIEELRKNLDNLQVRLEVLGYSRETKSKSLSSNLYKWIQQTLHINEVTPTSITSKIEKLRSDYISLFEQCLNQKEGNELDKKGRITRLKYLVGRLIYLGTNEQLGYLAESIKNIFELYLQFEIINAVLTEDISKIIRLGTNATQAAAQVLKKTTEILTCSLNSEDEDVIAALSIFRFHGIDIEFTNQETVNSPLYDFSNGDIESARKSEDSYLQEFVALHGNEQSRHSETLDTLFDENEIQSFDVLNAGAGSSYYFN